MNRKARFRERAFLMSGLVEILELTFQPGKATMRIDTAGWVRRRAAAIGGHLANHLRILKWLSRHMFEISTVAAQIAYFVIKELAKKELGQRRSDLDLKKSFGNALKGALGEIGDQDIKIDEPGALDHSFVANAAVQNELWEKLLNPSNDEEIDYDLLTLQLEETYVAFKAGRIEKETLRLYIDKLIDKLWAEKELRPLLSAKVIRQHDNSLSDLQITDLKRSYLEGAGKDIEAELSLDLGTRATYVDPLIQVGKGASRIGDKLEEARPNYRDEIIDVNTLFRRDHKLRYVILAESGLGKTTLLREIFRRLHNKQEDAEYIPIFLTPFQAKECSESNIRDKIALRLSSYGIRKSKINAFVDKAFESGEFILLIDALDQISGREHLLGALEGNCFGGNKVCLTTRPNVYEIEKGHLKNYTCLFIQDFGLAQWIDYLGMKNLNRLRKVVDDAFLATPMLLHLVSEYWLNTGLATRTLDNRSTLYSEMFTNLLNRQEEKDAARASGFAEFDVAVGEIRVDLQRLAFGTLAKNHLGQFPREQAIDILGDRRLSRLHSWRGIVAILEEGEFIAFRHRSFQEYLAAEYLKNMVFDKRSDDLEPYVVHPLWEETILFLAGLLTQTDLAILARVIIKSGDNCPHKIYLDHLRLASKCVREGVGKNTCLESEILALLYSHTEDGRLIGNVLEIAALLKGLALLGLLDELMGREDRSVRGRVVYALGFMDAVESVDILVEALGDPESYIRENAAYALGRIRAEGSIAPLIDSLKDTHPGVRRRSAYALRQMRAKQAIHALTKALYDSDAAVRLGAAYALADIDTSEACKQLISIVSQDDENLAFRESAVYVLGEMKSVESVPYLIQVLNDDNEDFSLQVDAVYALAGIQSADTLEPLREALNHDFNLVRWAAVHALNELRSTISEVGSGCIQKNRSRRMEWAAIALGECDDPDAILRQKAALSSEDPEERSDALFALRSILDPHIDEYALDALFDEDSIVREGAATILGSIDSASSVRQLLMAVKDKVPFVRMRVIASLGQLRAAESVPALVTALKGDDSGVRIQAAIALGKIGTTEAIDPLIDALADEVESVSEEAVNSLVVIGTNVVLDKLLKSFDSPQINEYDHIVLEAIMRCDKKIRAQATLEQSTDGGPPGLNVER